MGRRAGHIRFALPFGVLTLALWTLALAGGARAQAAYQPEFEVDVVAARGDDGGPRVDVYTSIPHQNLRFLARTGGFEATYTVSVEVQRVDERGRQQGLVATRSWEREVRVPTYVATQADSLADEALQSLPLAPGRYLAEVQVEDGASRRTFVREVPLTVRPFDGAFTVSDPLILDRYDSRGRRLFPNVGAALRTDQESFTLFYEIYAQQAADLRVSYVVTETSRARERPSARALLGLPVREQAQRGAPFVLSERLSVRPGRNPATLRLDTDRFRVGDYTLSLRLETAGGDLIAEVERPFAMRWMGLEGQIRNMDEAIAQLRYVAREREIREMRAASDAEKLRLFRAFWDRRDPTPGTRRNERMEEYYYRVAYANERYGRFRDQGWNTDRGEVYIRFGEPDFVEQHPFNYGTKPYEIWYYNRHGRRFIFVDETGLGDFRLLVPIWDERTRM
ncbi:MAG TPA: GWxTD domain-containing protein [Rubricoccaceae bacterium]|nr:GWxTD domain-containing protein [Rubricoccaceae bacterium]